MPKEIFDPDKFMELAEDATECRIKRLKDVIKLKLRTKKYLYTLKIKDREVAEEIVRRLRVPIVEV